MKQPKIKKTLTVKQNAKQLFIPHYEDGKDNTEYDVSDLPEIVVSGKNKSKYTQQQKFDNAKKWLVETWLPNRKKYLQDQIDSYITEYQQNNEFDPYNPDYGSMLKYVSNSLGLNPSRLQDFIKKGVNFANMDTFKQYLNNEISWLIDDGIKQINAAKLLSLTESNPEDYPEWHRRNDHQRRMELSPKTGAYILSDHPTHVFGRGDNTISEFVHELNHIGQKAYSNMVPSEINNNDNTDYYGRPWERHSRMMQYRYENSLDPLQNIYPDEEDLDDYHLKPTDPFNNVALNRPDMNLRSFAYAENNIPRYSRGKDPYNVGSHPVFDRLVVTPNHVSFPSIQNAIKTKFEYDLLKDIGLIEDEQEPYNYMLYNMLSGNTNNLLMPTLYDTSRRTRAFGAR